MEIRMKVTTPVRANFVYKLDTLESLIDQVIHLTAVYGDQWSYSVWINEEE